MATINLTEEDIYKALYNFIKGTLPNNPEVIRGIDNRLSTPLGDYVVVTITELKRLSTNIEEYNELTSEKKITQNIKTSVQIDCYGENSDANAIILSTLLRDDYGVDALAGVLTPLYVDSPIQAPLINSESQFEKRWILMAYFQFYPVITVIYENFDTATISLYGDIYG
jgi:hypothetical protein